jgi:nitroreductase
LSQEAILVETLIGTRQSILPKCLNAPGPTPAQIDLLFRAAAAAPDHGELTPWRFVLIPVSRRADLAEVFGRALVDRDAGATPEQIEAAREKAYRAPWLALAVACLGPRDPNVVMLERVVSLGCAIQNILLSAHSMGFGSGLTSGQAMSSPHMRALFQLQEAEEAVCFINVGTATKRRVPRLRPEPGDFVSSLQEA